MSVGQKVTEATALPRLLGSSLVPGCTSQVTGVRVHSECLMLTARFLTSSIREAPAYFLTLVLKVTFEKNILFERG